MAYMIVNASVSACGVLLHVCLCIRRIRQEDYRIYLICIFWKVVLISTLITSSSISSFSETHSSKLQSEI